MSQSITVMLWLIACALVAGGENDGTDPFNFEHNLGVVTRGFRPKPAYRALATVAGMLEGTRIDKPLDLGSDVIACRFAGKGGKALIALWSIAGDREAAVPTSTPIVLVDLMGATETLNPENGNVVVPLRRETPVFLVTDAR